MSERFDVVVVGAGIAGASVAYELAAHMSVLLVEAERDVGSHATGSSAALYISSYGGPATRALTAASLHDFEKATDELMETPALAPRGVMYVADVDGAELLARQERDLGLRPLSPEECQQQFPALRRETVVRAALDEQSFDIDVDGLMQGYLRGLNSRGGVLRRRCPVTSIRRDGRGWRLLAGTTAVSSGMVVNSAGAWADQVAHLAGVRRLGLVPMRRSAFTAPVTSPPGWERAPMVFDIAGRFYLRPEGAGQVLASPAEATPCLPGNARADELAIASALEQIDRYTTLGLRSVRARWAGLRTFSPDEEPVLGPDGDVPGFVWAAGQGGFGLQMAPALARTVASLATSGDLPSDVRAAGLTVADVSTERFDHPLLRTANR